MTESLKVDSVVRQGLDVQKFRNFCAFAKKNPADVMFGLEATGVAEGRAVHTLATTGAYILGGQRIDRIARRYSYHFGAHKEVEDALGVVDPTDREEVVEVALAALTGCINAVVSVSAAVRGLDLETLQTDVRISWDPAVFLHLKDVEEDGEPVDHFGDLKVELTITGERLCADDIAFIKKTVQRSAIFNLITLSHNHEIDVRVAEAV
jgi:hypothetical protein